MRRGQTVSIDFAIAMTIFIMMVIGGIFLLQRVTQPRTGFGTQVRDAAETAVDGFKDETEWTVFRTPVFVRSNRSLSDEPVTVATPFPGAVVAQSVLVMDGGTERPSQHNISGNETVVVTDLSEGTDRLDLVYTESGTLSDRSYDTGLASSGDMVWNSKVNLTFTDTGLSRLSFNGTGLLQSNADLDGSASPTVEQRPVRVNITYSTGRKHVRMFAESGQIRITEFFTGERDWQLNLSSSFDT
ncbi:MAG: hypothetical protein SVW77_03655, partial [Candidatus Nanohaloarchaea archaeon]|nr:hypothetical protein [Candidatus Nanohaloarchaea archaeon]